MAVVMICVGFASGLPCPWEGQFLKSYDPDVPDLETMDVGEWTLDLKLAMVFSSPSEGFACWQRQRSIPPLLNPAGRPNKPLTAFSVQLCPVEQAQEQSRGMRS